MIFIALRESKQRGRACRLLIAGLLAGPLPLAFANAPPGPKTVPQTVRYEIKATGLVVVLSDPGFLAASVEETPYQWLRLCAAAGACTTLADLRGSGGVSVASDPALGFSPDQRYLLTLRMTAVDAARKTYRSHSYEVYDIAAASVVTFRTAAGKAATADNIVGWSAQHLHALEVSAGHKKRLLALPPGER